MRSNARAAYQRISLFSERVAQSSATVSGNWQIFRLQILQQWKRLTPVEVDTAGPDYGKLASLIERKYGIAAVMIENYLKNFERTLPLAM